MAEARVECRTPTPGRAGSTRIPKWKFDAVRAAILDALAEGPVPFRELPTMVAERLSDSDRSRLGSVGWHATTVKLELEVRKEIRRLERPGRQMLALPK